MKEFGDWLRDMGKESDSVTDILGRNSPELPDSSSSSELPNNSVSTTAILDSDPNPRRAASVESQTGTVYNEWGNIEPNQGLIDDIMLDDGWMSLEVAQSILGVDRIVVGGTSSEDNEAAWRSVFNED